MRRACSVLAVTASLALGGCDPATLAVGVQVGGALAADWYCSRITEDARRAVRERVTDGVKVIPCEAP